MCQLLNQRQRGPTPENPYPCRNPPSSAPIQDVHASCQVPAPSFHDGNPPAGHPGGGPERGTIRDRAEQLKTRGKRAGIVKGTQVDGFKVGRSVAAILSRRWR